MSQATLLKSFDLLATAPGGVARLRELILTLAVQGKLVPQGPKDEPASELLKRIVEEKGRLIAVGKLKRDKPLPEIVEDEKPFELPRGWEFCRLGELLLSIRSGGTPSKQNPDFWNGSIPWASVKDLRFGEPITETKDRITQAGLDAGSQLAPAGSILICTRMGLGKIGEAMIDVAINQDLKAIHLGAGVSKQYFINYFKTLNLVGSGMTVAGIKQDELLGLVVPLPPEAEQGRIVARVEELMKLCDALAQKGRLADEQHTRLTSTLFNALANSKSAHALAENWKLVAEHFDLLLDRPEAVDLLEQTILQLAVRGLVTKQLSSDGTAHHVLVNPPGLPDGTARRRKVLRRARDTGSKDRLAQLPLSWEWISIQDLYDLNVIVDYADGNHGALYPRSEEFGRDGVTFVSAKDIAGGGISWEACSKLNEQRAAQLKKGWAKGGDVLLTHNATVGRVALVECGAPPFLLGTSVTFYRTNDCALDQKYLLLVFLSPIWQDQLKRVMEQTTRNQVSIQKQAELVIPLPPIDEQRRIVARVESLRWLCSELRQRLSSASDRQSQLAQVLVAQRSTSTT